MTNRKIAVLGLGLMGGGMARQLLAAGFDVTVWNRSTDKATALGQAGARIAATPADAATGADVVVAMLADDDVSRNVWTGENGALAAMAPGAIAIESSTLTGDWVFDLARQAAAQGVGFLEAPVTGSRDQAAQGTLRFLVGGEADSIATARPAFDAMGSALVHLGPVGSAATVKLANNFLCGVQAASLAEAIALFEKHGLDVEQAVSILFDGAPASPMVKGVGRRMLDRDYAPHFLVPLMAKDLGYAAQALSDVGIRPSIAQAARQRFLDADGAGEGQRDIAAIVEPLRKV
ncbi:MULTISPECIES: NAD(P)-dependent oxidoreductase [Sphingobium]|jgi:3-hydroxyisobutyrate dehydrogenase|uniref:NAD(P)-dependent oxidoreductase n=1 Tax=Sphingobium limneticum TaxID=1007511 RepID=A0A5J5HV42_9SPHN|nr:MULTISPECIES: NAD(P)-dependent oxidoreductase [Sphingobium]KAA9012024.1 NAD(P)-dependent oxidoreductase [Sphingobium limneticum]KAA9020415.1 NAD(P)-dependent oxidoreductase [Sphingobium limneticum]KAA9024475.1 NAD(P)-dependent oxidoreductase [Sphingobium limneticum]MBU0931722.1 NAD(P)-dependent oxidoreductase [Alphaproteobacteria bacterium]